MGRCEGAVRVCVGDLVEGLGNRLLPLGGRAPPLGEVGERKPLAEFALVGDELPESEV